MEFVSQQELKQKRDRNEKGCFYTCKKENQYRYSWGGTVCITEEEIKEIEQKKKGNSCSMDESEFDDYYMEHYENPSKKNEAFTLVKDDVFSDKKTSKAQ